MVLPSASVPRIASPRLVRRGGGGFSARRGGRRQGQSGRGGIVCPADRSCPEVECGGRRPDAARRLARLRRLEAFARRKEQQEQKEYRCACCGQDQKPVRLSEQGKKEHKINKIAAGGRIKQSGEGLPGDSRNRGKKRAAVFFRTHHAPIDEPG